MYLKNEVKKLISEAIDRKHFDLIHAETFYVMPNIPRNNIPIILAEQTIEYLVYSHYTEMVNFIPKRLLMNWDVAKIYFWEKRFWQKATRVVAMSEADKNVMQRLVKDLVVDLVPNGVDADFFSKRKATLIKKNKTILFVGNFKWLQNREAVEVLVRYIWPLIKRTLPEVKLWIVGRFPSKEILQFANNDIKVSDNISDIREAYINSDVLLAPIYGPGGTRYKILESMATGLPVVTTPTGIEGLNAVHGHEALICERPQDLAAETVKLLTKPTLYKKLVLRGRTLAKENFNWQAIANNLDRIYQEASHAKRN
ncbi:glycosyltransferase family 4 protein [Candidatus Gottesmanbacteria bacterium]|nr:glycosyltransferase family 4 protein [Candidatus Gottesmanbacteria bacterium]